MRAIVSVLVVLASSGMAFATPRSRYLDPNSVSGVDASPGATPAAAPAPTAAPIPAAAAAPDIAAWSADYDRARGQMIAGRFAEAAAAFSLLVALAPDVGRRLLATEQATICHTWATGGFALVNGSSEEAHDLRASRADQRTTGELATLYTTAVLYGVGAGIALAVGNEPDSTAGIILPSLLFAGVSAGAVGLLDHWTPLRYGVPQSIVSGMFIGLEEAIAWTSWNQASTFAANVWSSGEMAAVFWGGATAGALAGGILGTVYGTTPGRASFAGSGALWSGVIAGLATAAIVPNNDRQDDRALLAAAIALNVGGVAAAIAGGPISPSIARVRFVDLGGIAGGLIFGGLYLSLRDKQSSGATTAGFAAAGAAAGLTTGWFLTRNMEPDRPRRGDGPLSTLVPTLAPTANGAGMMLGVASLM